MRGNGAHPPAAIRSEARIQPQVDRRLPCNPAFIPAHGSRPGSLASAGPETGNPTGHAPSQTWSERIQRTRLWQARVPAQYLWHWGLGGLQDDKVLVRCSIGERCVRTLVVEEELVAGKGGSDARHGRRTVVEAPEPDPRRAVRPLHAAVPLGPPGRQDVRASAHLRCCAVPRRHPRTRSPFMAHEPRCRRRPARTATGTAVRRGGPSGSVRALARGVLPAVARE